jgi:hypothetical protein
MHAENTSVKVTIPDLRKFGFIMGSMIVLIFGLLFPWIVDKTKENWPIWPFIVMLVFFALALITPEVLRPVNAVWLKIGNILGWINSRIILGVMFYLLIFPIGLLLKLFGKDSMNRKLEKGTKSYRKVTKKRNKDHLEKPF